MLEALLNTYPARFLLQLFARRFYPSTDANCPAPGLSLGPLKRRYLAQSWTNCKEYLLVLETPTGRGKGSVKWIAARRKMPQVAGVDEI